MRLNKKNKIIELLSTLEEGVNYAKSASSGKSKLMLNDCYNGLVSILNSVDEENTIETYINKILQDFDKIIDKLNNEKTIEFEMQSIIKILNELSEYILNNISTELEIVFMPYKASMWDSMESIWSEAIGDEDCNCYVVPIPYYERASENNPLKLCYEGEIFPQYVDITHHSLYDLEMREPDIIYIHNPYDQYNTLTMICPEYFSSKLSKCTEMLVYVPYYISTSYKDEKEHGLFSILPGPINSNKIIAQSKNDREAYISNRYSNNKILDLGSPKFDAMFSIEKRVDKIIYEWKKISEDKKVFLLVTTVDDVLNNKNFIRDLKNNINNIVENDSICLIWRPHPLTDITIKNMRPNFLEEYNKLLKEIKKYNNIIFDDTSNAYTSISISDALISGNSSITAQYLITGKPTLSFMKSELLNRERLYCMDYLGCYFICDGITISKFIDMILKGEDPKKEERMERLKNSLTNIDGTCGEKIHKTIKEEVFKYKVFNIKTDN
ncbi:MULTISPECIES: CDP-glycerol glycerophosphotransferase family protein [unclassified Clostridium]|uniref:CDP-glycerol glycerophosphotransferase family protein n=1 Tax=unclassified Clostridium TaxID=2614128 RepID=UPI00207A8AE9|nr:MULTISPECIES: CDP-glycerol glycerophosphotransferase family protein [unclassified Clostridium]